MASIDIRPHSLQRIVYRSVALIETGDRSGLAEIIHTSDINNTGSGITGCLTLADGQFVQVLEGRSDKLRNLMGRVLADRRHRCIEVLAQREIEGRLFQRCGMALIAMPPASPKLVQIVTKTGGAAHVTGVLLALLEGGSGQRGVQRRQTI